MIKIRLRVRVHHRAIPRRVLALVLLAVVLLATLTLNRAFATVPGSPSSASAAYDQREFYLSTATTSGLKAGTICEQGYHFASMWEIADPSNLKYNTILGKTSADSGSGPPTRVGTRSSVPARGWVRTGYVSSTLATAGQGNCAAWSSDDSAHSGTVAHLVSDWPSGTRVVGPWNAQAIACDTEVPVWCVQSDSAFRVFLPVVIKH